MKNGQVHVYTGNGKGKTTAAFGLALRMRMAGKKVYIGQFVKSMKYNETRIVNFLDGMEIEQFGCGCMLDWLPDEEDKAEARKGLERCAVKLQSGDYGLVVLDEISIALRFGLLEADEVIEALESRNNNVEVVLTGRYAPDALIAYADLVTDMQEVKHYYTEKGLQAREGVER
ncbi:cob(I)yrinic acid a,c-diamide adenosyltransferase [Prevotella sp. HUN102]|uniref:cob(I)yrinic acid a,c-diamide adenosyltransferase n=1 Tax=Prevotella sp. HUN102 TaxID=1392486 RepID=UPI00048D5C7D|nr:cob(I)yrinic acid a,c-diamide adenosyltransferase [Prevotella sp. HUN102]